MQYQVFVEHKLKRDVNILDVNILTSVDCVLMCRHIRATGKLPEDDE